MDGPNGFVNPADLHNDPADLHGDRTSFFMQAFDAAPGTSQDDFFTTDPNPHTAQARDSAVDLTDSWLGHMSIKNEPMEFLNFADLQSPTVTNSPSPPIFSATHSPGDSLRDNSQHSSPDAGPDMFTKQEMDTPSNSWDLPLSSSEAIVMPQSSGSPLQVHLSADKYKTRAETQIKMDLTLDPVEYEYLRFPPQCLAKPKQHASDQDRAEIEGRSVIEMQVKLVCTTAVEESEDKAKALRRAAGLEGFPRRAPKSQLSELDKDDECHPQNGGEVVICEGCKERERKRYDRKKKKSVDDIQFNKYENDRVIMINEKEYKKLKECDPPETQFSSRAKTIEFAMRIACYCRHQEEKTPQGFKVIFTFLDSATRRIVAQHMSETFQITDDHKNKDWGVDGPARFPLYIPPRPQMPTYPHPSNLVIPNYHQSQQNQYAMGLYSQPTTPVIPNYQTPISPMEGTFQQQTVTPMSMAPQQQQQQPRVPQFSPTTATSASAASIARHQRGQSFYDQPLVSPSALHMPMDCQIPRPQSFDNFQFTFSHQTHGLPQDPYFASAPQSISTTPVNLSRPASPTWEQQPERRKKLQCVYFYVPDDEQ